MAEYLEREEVLFALKKLRMAETMSKHATYESCAIAQDAIEKAQIVVAGASAADVAPVARGSWKPFRSEAAGDIWYCSACEIGFSAKTKFCPNCGARMDGRE